MKTIFRLTPNLMFALMMGMFLVVPGVGDASDSDTFQSEIDACNAVQGEDDKALMKRQHHFTRGARYLLTHIQNQKSLFIKKNGDKNNQVNNKAENLANEANFSAAMGDYATGIKTLRKAYELVSGSVKELNE